MRHKNLRHLFFHHFSNIPISLDVVHGDGRLYMVFEYLSMDLKRHMDEVAANQENFGLFNNEPTHPGLSPKVARVIKKYLFTL